MPLPPPPPRKLPGRLLVGGLIALPVLVLACGFWIFGFVIPARLAANPLPTRTHPPLTTAAPTPTAGRPSPTTGPSAVTTTKPAAPPVTTPAAPRTSAAAPPKPPPYAAAATIMRNANQHYRQQLAAGKAAFNTPGFGSWYQATMQDQTCETERIKADNAQPATGADLVTPWYEDCAEASSHIDQWASAALSAEPGPANSTMAGQESSANTYLTAMDAAATTAANTR